MATKTNENTMAPLKTDLTAALIIGVVAGILSPIAATVNNINISWIVLFVGFVVLCLAGIMVGRFMSKYVPLLYKLAKFGEAGGLNWLVDLGLFNILVLLTGLNSGIYFIAYKALSFIAAATNSYFWNKLWVFSGGKAQDRTQEVGKFVAATLLGMGFNVALAWAILSVGPVFISAISSTNWPSVSVIGGSLGAMLFNFILYKVWVFKS